MPAKRLRAMLLYFVLIVLVFGMGWIMGKANQEQQILSALQRNEKVGQLLMESEKKDGIGNSLLVSLALAKKFMQAKDYVSAEYNLDNALKLLGK